MNSIYRTLMPMLYRMYKQMNKCITKHVGLTLKSLSVSFTYKNNTNHNHLKLMVFALKLFCIICTMFTG